MTEYELRQSGDVTRLPHRIAIYVPTLTQTGGAITNRQGLLSDVQGRLARLCGGTTSTDAQGTFVTDDGRLVSESVTIVYASCIDLGDVLDGVLETAQLVKTLGRQESVVFEVDQSLYLL